MRVDFVAIFFALATLLVSATPLPRGVNRVDRAQQRAQSHQRQADYHHNNAVFHINRVNTHLERLKDAERRSVCESCYEMSQKLRAGYADNEIGATNEPLRGTRATLTTIWIKRDIIPPNATHTKPGPTGMLRIFTVGV
ncbi:hypothetical protein PIIN_06842 [Serendipita indica DSM 11827]|uniref:Uncharacterized protein n=1 Tax=Serendipita indica (strain DSM 11827) TaxID=1109443 RepID=G4TNL3_SERID|nr:hypothetical protein PIIN_06842 [Serendipita indica DSM 11827]